MVRREVVHSFHTFSGHSANFIMDECGRPANEPKLFSCIFLQLTLCIVSIMDAHEITPRVRRRRVPHEMPFTSHAWSVTFLQQGWGQWTRWNPYVPDRAFPNARQLGPPRSLVPSHIRASTADACHALHDFKYYFKSSAAWKARLLCLSTLHTLVRAFTLAKDSCGLSFISTLARQTWNAGRV